MNQLGLVSFAIFFLASLAWSKSLPSVVSYLSDTDLARLQKVFKDGLAANDIQSMYYSIVNVAPISGTQKDDFCKRSFQAYKNSKINEFEKIFYFVGIHKKVGCVDNIPKDIIAKINVAFDKKEISAQEMYYSILAYKALEQKINGNIISDASKKLQNLLKKEDSLSTLGYAFHIASEWKETAAFAADRVEDAIVQADEVDGKMLQFEGGLSITALVITGALKVSKSYKKPIPITTDQAVKFATYFLSRRSVQTAKGAHLLIDALTSLTSEPAITPVCIQIIGNGQLEADSPNLNIRIVDLLGKPISPAPQSIFAKVTIKKDNAVLAEKVNFVSKSSDKTVYSADLLAFKPSRGIYTAELSADSYTQLLNFKVLGRVKVHSLEIGVGDSDATSTIKKRMVSYPSTLPEVLLADTTQKLVMKLVLNDEGTTKVMTVHQAFVRFYNKDSNEEIVYIAEQDTSKAYKFDMDVGARSADFADKSGLYQIELIVGDASLSNSFTWHIASVQFKFTYESKVSKGRQNRTPLPEIVHQFRKPEARPPRIVSDIFTGLCLTPLVLLFILWGKLGINVSNFTFNISTIGFHLGLGSILGLFVIFWLQLNMFQTLRLLFPLAVLTFLCGNRLLRRIASQKSY